MEMRAEPTMIGLLALAVGAGLLAVFVVWVGKQIGNPQTRAQGIAAVGIAMGVLVLGFFVMSTRTVVHMAPATVTSGGVAEGSISMERNGDMEVHVHRGHPSEAHRVSVSPPSTPMASGPAVGQAQFAWGPVTMAVIVVGVIAIIVSSKRGLAAALSCLGIVAAVLVMYVFAARSSHDVAWVPEVTPRVATPSDWDTTEYRTVEPIPPTEATPEEVKAEADAASGEKADVKSDADDKLSAESSSPADSKATVQTPPPAWVGSEPTMEAGVYRAVAVSGPYSTKRECEAQLDEPLRNAMMEYANDYLPPNARFHAWMDTGYIRNYLIEERYLSEEQYEHVMRPMYNLHVRLKVGPEHVARFNALAHEWRVRQAVEETSIGGLFVLGSLVVAYGALRYGCRKKRAGSQQADSGSPGEVAA